MPRTSLALARFLRPNLQPACSLSPQGNLRAIHLEYPRVASGGAKSRSYTRTGQKPQFHQAAGIVARQIDSIQDGGVTLTQVNQRRGHDFRLAGVATQLHLGSSMRESEMLVKRGAAIPATFLRRAHHAVVKCARIKDNRMVERYSVRRARPGDMERILEIETASFGRDAYDRNLFAALFRRCEGLFLVVEDGPRVCGYMVCCRRGNWAELVSVAVDPKARGRGAASRLMESTIRRLRDRRVIRLRLMVKVNNCKARAFYEKYGFEKVRVVRGYYQGGGDGLMMARMLR
jgi:ribosomal-protein-alanine N-acetyltransferase